MGFSHVMPWNALNNRYIEVVQSGEVVLADTATSITDALTAVTKNKSFLIFSYKFSAGNNDAQNVLVNGEITNDTTLTFSRFGTTGDVTIFWYVVTFKASAPCSVEHGTHTMLSTSDNVSISSINQNNAFPIITVSASGTGTGADDYIGAQITSATNLQLTVNTFSANREVKYQIVNCPFWNVYEYTSSALATDTLNNVNLSPPVDENRSFFVVSGTVDGGYSAYDFFRHRFLLGVGNDIQAFRNVSNSAVDFIYYVVEADVKVKTQQSLGTTIPAGSDTTTRFGLSQNVNNSVILFPRLNLSSGNSDSGNPNMNNNGIMCYISSATEYICERGFANPGINTTGDFTIIDFTDAI